MSCKLAPPMKMSNPIHNEPIKMFSPSFPASDKNGVYGITSLVGSFPGVKDKIVEKKEKSKSQKVISEEKQTKQSFMKKKPKKKTPPKEVVVDFEDDV